MKINASFLAEIRSCSLMKTYKAKVMFVLSFACLLCTLLKPDAPGVPNRILRSLDSGNRGSERMAPSIVVSDASSAEESSPQREEEHDDHGFLGMVCPQEKWAPMIPIVSSYYENFVPDVSQFRLVLDSLQQAIVTHVDALQPIVLVPQSWERPTAKEANQRFKYFALMGVASIVVACLFAEAVWFVSQRIGSSMRSQSDYNAIPLLPADAPALEPVEVYGPICKNLLFVPYFIFFHGSLYLMADFAVANGLVLGKSGLLFELWGIFALSCLLADVLFWVLALFSGRNLKLPHPSGKIVMGMLPITGPRFDNAKDYVFTAMCFAAAHCAEHAREQFIGMMLGYVNLLCIFVPVPFLLLSRTRRHELWAEYTPALELRGVGHDKSTAKAQVPDGEGVTKSNIEKLEEFIVGKVNSTVDAATAQCTSAKLYMILGEDLGQGACAVCFMFVFGGSPFVIFSLVVSAVKVAMVFVLRILLRRAFLAGYGSPEGLRAYARTMGHEICERIAFQLVSELKIAMEGGFTPAQRAAMKGNIDMLRALSELRVDIHEKDNMGRTPAHWSAVHGYDQCLRILFESPGGNKAFREKDEWFGDSVTHFATEKNRTNIMQTLYDLDPDLIDLKGWHGEASTHLAAKMGLTNALEKLLSLGATVDARDEDDNTPALIATKCGNVECLNVLKKHGASFSIDNVDKAGNSLAHCAAMSTNATKCIDVLGITSSLDSSSNFDGWLPVHVAASVGNVAFLEECMRKNVSLQATYIFNGEMGIVCGDDGIVQEVIANSPAHEKGIKPGHKIVNVGSKPFSKEKLRHAQISGSDYDVQLESSINVKSKDLSTPAHVAAKFGHDKFLQKLLALGACFNQPDKDGNLPVHVAVRNKHWMCLEVLANTDNETQWHTTLHTRNADYKTPEELFEEPHVDSLDLKLNLRRILTGQAKIIEQSARSGLNEHVLTGTGDTDFVESEVCGMEVLLVEASQVAGFSFIKGKSFEAFVDSIFHGLVGRANFGMFVDFRVFKDGEVVPYKGELVQKSCILPNSYSPRWSDQPELKWRGGWLYSATSPGLSNEVLHFENIVFDFTVMQSIFGFNFKVASIQLPVTQRQFATNPKEKLKEIWLPLKKMNQGKLDIIPGAGLHIMTLSHSAASMATSDDQIGPRIVPELNQLRWPEVSQQRLREPVFELEVQYGCFNPNLARDCFPEQPSDARGRIVNELASAVAHAQGIEMRQARRWQAFAEDLGEYCDFGNRYESGMPPVLRELLQAGVPGSWREKAWLICARTSISKDYDKSLNALLSQQSEEIRQIHEDVFNLSSWETSAPPQPEFVDRHQERLRKSARVCMKLAHSDYVVYCESLLVVTYFLLLPQGADKDNKTCMPEPSAFSILHALIAGDALGSSQGRANGILNEYYGQPDASSANSDPTGNPINHLGAMDDVALLECCLAYHEPELWCTLNKLGFQLCTVFYGAFMRLYATYMPTASVFRFWDLLFGLSLESTDHVPRRSYIIDLAFSIMRASKHELLMCESAFEIRSVILSSLGNLFCTDLVVEWTLAADTALWGRAFSASKVRQLWVRREDLFQHVHASFQDQAAILKSIMHNTPLGKLPFINSKRPTDGNGVTTKELVNYVLPRIRQASNDSSHGRRKYWAMHRPMPLADKALFENATRPLAHKALFENAISSAPIPPIPFLTGPSDVGINADLEPSGVSKSQMERIVCREVPNWSRDFPSLWRAFTNRQNSAPQSERHDDEEGVSLNELFAAMISTSKGTVTEKAVALFNLFSYSEPLGDSIFHITPVTKQVKVVVSSLSSNEAVQSVPPERSTIQQNALHFTVYSDIPQKGTMLGEVVVPSLGPFVGKAIDETSSEVYNLWRDKHGDGNMVVAGEMRLAISWAANGIKANSCGQLTIRLHSVCLYKRETHSMEGKQTPYVKVTTSKEREIPRWDPRRLSNLNEKGPFGGVIEFSEPNDVIGKETIVENRKQHTWTWDDLWGKQLSKADAAFDSKCFLPEQRKNAIDIQAVRHIVTWILHRNMLNVTNRQAVLIADSLFNRQGAVPGILEAIITPGIAEEPLPEPLLNSSLKAVKQGGARFVDVTRQIVAEHERQLQLSGRMNLFHPHFMQQREHDNSPRKLSLNDMSIADPFPGQNKIMWIRYVRSGDSERCTQCMSIDPQGQILSTPEIKLDPPQSSPQTIVTKEEFLACILSNPLLNDCLRHCGVADKVLQPQRAVSLTVEIMDNEVQDDPLDDVNIGQSILLECFSEYHGLFGSKAFLGEAWLPPLFTLPKTPKEMVLHLHRAELSDDAENPSRPDKHKSIKEDAAIQGELTIQVGWEFPDPEGKGREDDHESARDRALKQERLATGRLTLRIVSGKGLGTEGKRCDPQVTAWVRNDINNKWRVNHLLQTKVKTHSRNPKWYHSESLRILSAPLEAKLPQEKDGLLNILATSATKQRKQDARYAAALRTHTQPPLPIHFTSSQPKVGTEEAFYTKQGRHHAVSVFLDDTIREFKVKLNQACKDESAYWKQLDLHNGFSENHDKADKYDKSNVDFQHVVMVFQPPAKLRELLSRGNINGEEYKHAYVNALNDPSSWEPIDASRTLRQCEQYGWGDQDVRLRVLKPTKAYLQQNLRYKKFVEREHGNQSYQDENDSTKCFGYAKYWHAADRNPEVKPGKNNDTRDFEWRPALISRAITDQKTGTKATPSPHVPSENGLRAEWIFKPIIPGPAGSENRVSFSCTYSDVIFAHRCTPIADLHPAHQDLLEGMVPHLRNEGKSVWEMEVIINNKLDRFLEDAGDVPDNSCRPPRITADTIRQWVPSSELQMRMVGANNGAGCFRKRASEEES